MSTTHQPVESAAVWHAADVADPGAWTIILTGDQRAAIVDAAQAAHATGRTPVLGDLDPVIAQVVRRIRDGHGFVLLRGFPVDQLTPAEVELAYLGLGHQLGTPVGQDAQATLLGHVRDEGVARTSPAVRLYRTRARQDFHTDGADIVGLLCLHRARSGGESRLASAHAVYNHILATRPELIDVLYEPLWWDRNDEQSAGEDPAFALPVLHDIDGVPRVFYIGWYIRDAQRHPRVPRLTPLQLAAMDAIESTANDPRFYVEMDFQPGDVQLIANAKILHAREAYEDHDDPARRRHLLRLWLTAHDFASVDDVLRAGIPQRKA